MSTAIHEQSIRVIISKDLLTAELIASPQSPPQAINEQLCLAALHEAGILINDQVTANVKTMANQDPPDTGDLRTVVAQGTPPQHGQPGHIQWLIDNPEQDNSQSISHYDRSTYRVVKTGDTIAKVIQPTLGVDGHNVQGHAIPAKPGLPIDLEFDESIMQDASGNLIAQQHGLIESSQNKIQINQILQVDGYVDFSTGNIDFIGNVLIHRGVRDCFIVKATGQVEVKGLIEAATIDCEGDLIAHGGMAGRERGNAIVGGTLSGKYLDNVTGQIQGDLQLDREVINCELTIHGQVLIPHGRITGGKLCVTGPIDIASLGSAAGTHTHLVLGSVPRLEPTAQALAKIVKQLADKHEALLNEQKQINDNTRRLTACDRERQTEICFELHTAQDKLAKGLAANDALIKRIDHQRTVNLLIHSKLHPGVMLTILKQSFKVQHQVSGPLTIYKDSGGQIVYRKGSTDPVPLTQIAKLHAADRSPNGS